jgi:hypothetical protein
MMMIEFELVELGFFPTAFLDEFPAKLGLLL